MKKALTISASLLAGAVLMLSAAPAMARVDVDLNIGVPGPVYMQPEPVYVQPRPVYVQPRPVYVQTRPYYEERDHHRRYNKHHHRRHDRDGDGVPNRYDHRPYDPYRY